MSEAEKFAAIFHAAAEGALQPERDFYGKFGARMIYGDNGRDRAFSEARTLSGMLKAVGDLFAKTAEAESET